MVCELKFILAELHAVRSIHDIVGSKEGGLVESDRVAI